MEICVENKSVRKLLPVLFAFLSWALWMWLVYLRVT